MRAPVNTDILCIDLLPLVWIPKVRFVTKGSQCYNVTTKRLPSWTLFLNIFAWKFSWFVLKYEILIIVLQTHLQRYLFFQKIVLSKYLYNIELWIEMSFFLCYNAIENIYFYDLSHFIYYKPSLFQEKNRLHRFVWHCQLLHQPRIPLTLQEPKTLKLFERIF